LWRLPQSVQGLAQLEHLALLPRDDEAGGLPHIHLLLEAVVEENRLDIHVMYAPPLLGSEREENVDELDTSHGRERIIVVDRLLLDEAAHDEPRLVLDHFPSLVLLELEHPLRSDRAMANMQVDEHQAASWRTRPRHPRLQRGSRVPWCASGEAQC
jgi:hypothetical protein